MTVSSNEERHSRVPTPGQWSDVMNETIKEAIRNGAFDDLPGKGKPLKLLNNLYFPGTELAYQLLKDNDYTLPGIAERGAVTAKVEALWVEINRVWTHYPRTSRLISPTPPLTSMSRVTSEFP